MTISSGSVPSPKYQRLAADLRRRIAAGEWRGDTALPVESELEQQYGVARNTVRLAVDVLVNEGRLVRLQGKGTFLREHPVLDHWAFGPPLTASSADAVAQSASGSAPSGSGLSGSGLSGPATPGPASSGLAPSGLAASGLVAAGPPPGGLGTGTAGVGPVRPGAAGIRCCPRSATGWRRRAPSTRSRRTRPAGR